MPEHVHIHPPEELTETEHLEAHTRRERWLEFVAILLMSISTVGIAWSGYQAASWSGTQARAYAESNSEHEHATREGALGSQERLEDLEDFNHWLEATAMGNTTSPPCTSAGSRTSSGLHSRHGSRTIRSTPTQMQNRARCS